MPNDDAPAFNAPWQAQAFAMAVHLNEQGLFTWSQWSDALAEERHRSAAAGVADEPDQYYLDWLRALERLISERGESDPEELRALRDAWVAAYEATPHGRPVRLERGLEVLAGSRGGDQQQSPDA